MRSIYAAFTALVGLAAFAAVGLAPSTAAAVVSDRLASDTVSRLITILTADCEIGSISSSLHFLLCSRLNSCLLKTHLCLSLIFSPHLKLL